ncbi:MAG: ABC transporter permease, partial [Rhodospirillales bacterium]|nr:ABC transporter permease [Rhodospirillales bacterium]
VELKAVDAAWPMAGAATLDPPAPVARALAGRGMVVDPLVLARLGLKTGDTVRLGTARFILRGTITAEPDRVATPAFLGPRALIALPDLAVTGLVQPGTLDENRLRAVLPPGTDIAATLAAVQAAFPDQGWHVRTARDAAPGMSRFIDRTSLFLTLVGLTALLVGGIGVANGTSAWLAARARTIATLRCLGASGRLVFAMAFMQVMALCGLGIVAGLAIGATLPMLATDALRGVLPVPPVLGIYPAPLALAGLYGLLTAAACSLAPLARTLRIPGAALFRDAVLPARVRGRLGLIAANAALAAALVALTVATADNRRFALYFCAAALGALAVFRLGGLLATRLAARAPHRGRVWLRLGLANLHRPGNATALLLVSLGLGLSTLASVALIEGNLRRQVAEQMPAHAPSFFFIDIQNDEMARFRRILAATAGVRDMQEVPSLRARIVAVAGVPAAEVRATPDTRWALRGDRGLTYAATMPKDTHLVAGHWWPADYAGPPLVSLDAHLARGWGVRLGDVIRVNVLGRDIDLRVASLRDIAWRTLSLNFAMVASPGLLAAAPHTHIATVRADPAAQAPLLRAVTDALPNVSGILVADVLHAVADLLGQIGAALAATGSLTLAAGALVLAGAVAAGQQRRIRQAVILKALGATRGQIRAAWLVEFGLVGAAAGAIAALVGTAASWAVVHGVMGAPWVFLPGTLALTVLACIVLMLAFGYAGTAVALRAKAAPLLRNE